MFVLVEGDSDAGAVHALAEIAAPDVNLADLRVHSAHGVTNYSKVLADLVRQHPGESFCGLYDLREERHVRLALVRVGYPSAAHQSLEEHRFFACDADLEEELIRAVGTNGVLEVVQAEGELESFRRFQAMPQHRDRPLDAQLHRFLGTRATRKIRCAKLIAQRLTLGDLPPPFAKLVEVLRHGTACGQGAGDA